MPRGRTFDPEKRARIAELHAQGWSLQRIAAELGASASTISKYAKLDGLSFDRSRTKAATEAHKADSAKLRAEISHELLLAARGFLTDIHRPFLVFNFGGKDNTYAEHELDRPPTGDIRNLMTSAGIALQRSLELSRFDADPNEGAAAVDAWIDHMAGQ